jgi:hypothetical protein
VQACKFVTFVAEAAEGVTSAIFCCRRQSQRIDFLETDVSNPYFESIPFSFSEPIPQFF